MDSPGPILPPSQVTTVTHMRTLCTELWNLRAEGAFCDVIFTIQGEHLSAHSVILSACSPYLKNLCMDRSSITPSGVVNVHLDEYCYKVCIKTLEFLYTGEKVRFEEPELQKEFERLAKDWKLFGGAFRADESMEEENKYLPDSISDESDETDDPLKMNDNRINRNRRKKPKTETESRSKINIGEDSGGCFGRNYKQKGRKPARRKAYEMSEEELNEANETDDEESGEQEEDNITDDIPDDLLQLHTDIDHKDKDPLPLGFDDDQEYFSHTETEGDRKIRKKNKKKSAKSKDINTKVGRVKRVRNSERNASKEGGQRGRKNNCYRCDIQFESREAYLAHGQEVHPRRLLRKQELTCKICNARFYHFNLLRIHKLENHWEEGMRPAKVYKCDFENCNYSTMMYAAFNAHRKGHTAERCICSICGKLLKHRYSLRTHMENVHERKHEKYCAMCDKTFFTRKAYQNHERNMHCGKTTRLICSTCGYTCKGQDSLKEHMFTAHNDPVSTRLFFCATCNFKTTMKRKFEQHERTHNPEPLQCEECGKSYASRNSLSLHMRIHNKTAKIYKCNYCDYKTVFGVGTLRKHLNAMHKDKEMKPWKCTDCSYSAMTKDIFDHHRVTIHGYPIHETMDSVHDKQTMNSYEDTHPPPLLPPHQHIPNNQHHHLQQGPAHEQITDKTNLPPAPHGNPIPTEPQMNITTSEELRPMISQNHMQHVDRPDDKALPPMPLISSRAGPPGFVDVPLNYSLFRTAAAAAAAAANPANFPHDPSNSMPPSSSSSSQVLMVPGQLAQAPMLPGNLNPLHDWADFQSF